ncbi:unnamed protein product [Dovyalis caffra]|uniref:Uncharacterized protein n=1 Tax=Dovyalis caffra TaxID=77055 RepID=A0AAV1SHA3_9ROSI|nr:unnamed protein product [Dovyalis caffra]
MLCYATTASISHLEGVNFLLAKFCNSSYQRDRNGQSPTHIASAKGYVELVKQFLQRCPDSRELLNGDGQNILHVAVKNGKSHIPKIVNNLTQDWRVHLRVKNKEGLTAEDIACGYNINVETAASIRKDEHGFIATQALLDMTLPFQMQRLILLAIRIAYAQRSQAEDLGLIPFVLNLSLRLLGSSNYHILRYVAYYPFRLMLFIFGSYNDEELGD